MDWLKWFLLGIFDNSSDSSSNYTSYSSDDYYSSTSISSSSDDYYSSNSTSSFSDDYCSSTTSSYDWSSYDDWGSSGSSFDDW
ncbi:MAG: hypothetical protein N2596_04370 [Syntrophorhabdaceae bacterium]|nr:hypothetical protein [Syntrophorhabdaceae bacterium]